MSDSDDDVGDDRSFGVTRTIGHNNIVTQMRVEFAAFAARFDTFLKMQAARDKTLNDQVIDHEKRLRELEQRRYVEPKTVWAAIALLFTFGSLVVAIIGLATR